MASSRREFIKSAAVAGTAAAAGAGMISGESDAMSAYGDGPVDTDERCPYFDQPLFCSGKSADGKLLCDE